ncbi:AAA family ATPase [Streptomyces sp. HUAS ZL42]|uniref:AAA family ATPase n=1 Tax=Streptomyces sp. HUAS ZL42 TaxID=3231715 RepID=UPI00345E5DE6
METPGRLFISLLGPPNVGKSTLAAKLSDEFAAAIIRPRDAIRGAIQWRPGLADLFGPVDHLGWSSDYALAFAVRLAVDAVRSRDNVLLENLPWDVLQLLDLYRFTADAGARLTVLLIDTPDEVLLERGSNRRVCQTCERDPSELPRRPAHAAASDPDRCATCGGALSRRPDDSETTLVERIRRSRRYLTEMRHCASALDLPIRVIDGTSLPERIYREARDAVASIHR